TSKGIGGGRFLGVDHGPQKRAAKKTLGGEVACALRRALIQGRTRQGGCLGIFATARWKRNSLQFRAEVYNIFNAPQFALPGNNPDAPGGASISSTLADNQREIQF